MVENLTDINNTELTLSQLKDILIKRRQVFLTGAGGTGKSYSTKLIRAMFKNPVTLASTNSAAILIGGDTVHSFFALGKASTLQELNAEDKSYIDWFCKKVNNNPAQALQSRINKLIKLLSKADLIIIDEVSMISSNVFDLIYSRFRQCGLTPPPMLLVGDLYQLPPVSKDNRPAYDTLIYNSQYFNPYIVELTSIKRSQNPEFTKALRAIRVGKYTEHAHNIIMSILENQFTDDYNPTILVSTNAKADKINHTRLSQLNTPEYNIEATIETDIKDERRLNNLYKDLPVSINLKLKQGCRVMFIATDKEQGFYNGLQGTVKHIKQQNGGVLVTVDTDDGKEITPAPMPFTKNKVELILGEYQYKPELTVFQLPLRVCYAMTIHKSQGASITQLEIDCDGIFEKGQFYVAISRATDPTQIRLRNFDKSYVRNQIVLKQAILDSHKIPEFKSDNTDITINI